jgi:predicted glycosyltransferase involved in capsule biosynthesis
MSPTVIIPWKEEASRRPGFEWVLRYHKHRFDKVIVSEHDDGPLFNKSKAINDGIKKANPSPDDIFIIGDADCFVADWALRDGIKKASQSSKLIRPHRLFLRTSAEQADWILKQDPRQEIYFKWFHKHFKKKPAPGGLWVLRFQPFADAGWMDEGFVGWGGEDCDMVRRMGSVVCNGPLYHIWHEPAFDKNFSSPGCQRIFAKYGRRR